MTERTLNLSQCKEYLKNIMSLELLCYQQQKLLQALDSKVEQSKISLLKEERIPIEEPPEKTESSHGMDFAVSLVIDVAAILIGAVVGLGVGLIRWLCSGDGFFSNFANGVDAPIGPYLKSTAFIAGGITGGVVLLYLIWSNLTFDVEKNYHEQLEAYNKKKTQKEGQVAKAKSAVAYYSKERDTCEGKLKDTRQLLAQYYDMGFIYRKYRGLVPVCTIYEYLESGRCFSLLGHEGAYNLYENEMRMNMIIEKLDDIIERLDDISNNQRLLVDEIKASNSKIDSICRSLERIDQNTALTQYYSSVTASNTTFMSWLAALNYDEQKRNR